MVHFSTIKKNTTFFPNDEKLLKMSVTEVFFKTICRLNRASPSLHAPTPAILLTS